MKMKMKMKNVALRVRLMVFTISLLSFVFPAAALTSEITLSISDGKTVVSPSSNVSNSSHDNWMATSDNIEVATVEMKTSSSTSTRTPEIYVTPVAKGKCTVTVQYGTSGSNWKLTVNVTEPVKGAVVYAGYEIPYEGNDVEAKANVGVNKDTVLIFKSGTGVFTVPVDMVANVLVVGGGGSGACGSGSGYYGGAGAGGSGELKTGIGLPAGAYAVSVGAGGESVPQKTTTGKKGGNSSLSGEGSFEAISGAGGAAGSGSSQSPSANGNGCKITTDITGTSVTYGTGGAKATKAETPVNGTYPGDGGQGNYYKYSSGAGANGIVVVRITGIAKVRTPIVVPTPTTAFTFDNTVKTCVAAGAYYTRGGTYEATNAGEYTATVTPDDDHCWTGGSRAPVEIKWTIARRPVTVTVVNTNKVEGAVFIDPDQQTYNDPIWTTTTEGLIASDTTELTWDIFRTNACEEVGVYDLLVEGAKKQGNYELTFVGGKYEICEAPPPGPTVVPVTETDQPITGVDPEDIRIVYTADSESGSPTYDITAAFTLTGSAAEGVTATLNPVGAVTVGEGAAAETITVVPQLTEGGDTAVEPFEVAGDEVDVGVKTIPGLKYTLRRSETVITVSQGATVDAKRAETTRTKLRDPFEGGRPAKAFYRVEVGK